MSILFVQRSEPPAPAYTPHGESMQLTFSSCSRVLPSSDCRGVDSKKPMQSVFGSQRTGNSLSAFSSKVVVQSIYEEPSTVTPMAVPRNLLSKSKMSHSPMVCHRIPLPPEPSLPLLPHSAPQIPRMPVPSSCSPFVLPHLVCNGKQAIRRARPSVSVAFTLSTGNLTDIFPYGTNNAYSCRFSSTAAELGSATRILDAISAYSPSFFTLDSMLLTYSVGIG